MQWFQYVLWTSWSSYVLYTGKLDIQGNLSLCSVFSVMLKVTYILYGIKIDLSVFFIIIIIIIIIILPMFLSFTSTHVQKLM